MKNEKSELLDEVDSWKAKYSASMEEQVELQLAADPSSKSTDIKISYLIEKVAVLTVSIEYLKKQISKIEQSK
jgi:hypothetical protein